MIRASILPELLQQASVDGDISTILMTTDGAVLGFSPGTEKTLDSKFLSAVVSNIWSSYEQYAISIFPSETVKYQLVEFEESILGISTAGKGYLICAYTTRKANIGYIKAKLMAMAQFLEKSLSEMPVPRE